MRPRNATFTLLALLLVVLAGCGGEEAAEPGPESPAETSTAGDSADGPPDGEAPARTREVEVFFTNLELGEIGEVHPVVRETTDDDLPRSALEHLLAGPTSEERAEGYSSWFSQETSDLLVSLRTDDSVAFADFDAGMADALPGASTSAGSLSLLAELDATLEQFEDVSSTRYSLGGDVAAFYEWLQLVPPDAAPGDEPASSPSGPTRGTAPVEVFFPNPELGPDGEAVPVERRVEAPAVLRGALEALLRGPTAEEADRGYTSWFSSDTAGFLEEVWIDDRVARVDLDPRLPEVIPGASSAAGSTALLESLDATATQFASVDRVVYSLDGDVAAFYRWLQREPPEAT